MRMWKKICAVMTAGTICAMSLPWTVSAKDYTYGDLTYTVFEGGTVEITDCNESATEVEIPAEIDGMAVTSIGKETFSECTSLTDITIPDSVTSIGWSAFSGCTSLTEITIPDSVTSIAGRTFLGCNSLTQITILDSVTIIGSYAFTGCTSLTEITIPDSMISIEHGAFGSCTSLTEVIIPDSVIGIGWSAFGNCTSLTDVYYSGTEEEWNAIELFTSGNDYLLNATIHFNSTSFEITPSTGDIDGDNTVDANDAYFCLLAYAKMSVGSRSGLTDAQIQAADVNDDGTVDANDAYYILLYYAKKSVGQDVSWAELLG
ncbi:leucine-rich repeat protein [Ruminococcus sp.]|uniref:leucine-rich repeat protein n=1 Tax=Ruminococcus sp. TaxID=41978 RepID=UPI0025D2BE2A|nr:leucine-rich repeat protein [Ruminococcus sp.]